MKKKKKIDSDILKDLDLQLYETKRKSYGYIKKDSKLSFKYWKEWYIDRFYPRRAILINMELLNGFHSSFLVKEKDEGFVFNNKKYLFDDDSKYYNMDAKLWSYDYHESVALPIKRKFPLNKILNSISNSKVTDIEYAINPSTLGRFMTAKIAEGVMKGAQLDEFLRRLNMYILVIMVAVLVHLFLFLHASGVLENLNIPFI